MRKATVVVAVLIGAVLLTAGGAAWLTLDRDAHQVGTQAMGGKLATGRVLLHLPGEDGRADLRRGDVVIIDGTAWPDSDSTLRFPIRVVGLPGDTVSCCDQDGRLMVNGTAISEPYAQGETGEFADVVVPAEHLFLLGDSRELARDSRMYLEHGSGAIPQTAVHGRSEVIVWPPWRIAEVGETAAFDAVADPAAPSRGHRHWYALSLIAVGGLVLLAVGVWGGYRGWQRRSRSRKPDVLRVGGGPR